MKQILSRLIDHQNLDRKEATEVLTRMAEGAYNDSQIAAFITVYLMRSITLDELAGFRDALLQLCIPVDLSAFNPIDIVGTGGDGKNTFNISTLSSLVVAGAGYKVAKHGNYGVTSVSGASNVLEYLGAKFSNDASQLQRSIEQSGFCFLHAPLFNPAMKKVAPVRKDLGVRTFFNILGPMVNPAKPTQQLLGVYNLKLARLYQYMYQQSGINYTIVHSLDGYDEISLTDSCKMISNKGEQVLTPKQMGFDRLQQDQLSGGDTIAEAAAIFKAILDNNATPAQTQAVLANSAAAIQTCNPALSFADAVDQAREALQSGKAKRVLSTYIELNAN